MACKTNGKEEELEKLKDILEKLEDMGEIPEKLLSC